MYARFLKRLRSNYISRYKKKFETEELFISFFFFSYIYVPKWKELILAEALRLECPVSQAIIILKFMKHSDIISVLRHAIKNEFKYA